MNYSYHLFRQEQKRPPPSYVYIGKHTTIIPPDQTVDEFKDFIQDQIDSLTGYESRSIHADDFEVQVYKVIQLQCLPMQSLTVVL